VIDPVPVAFGHILWCGHGMAYDAKVDNNHQVFICGQTSSTNNIATAGAFRLPMLVDIMMHF